MSDRPRNLPAMTDDEKVRRTGKITPSARYKVEDVVLVHRVGVPGALIRAQQRILLNPGAGGMGQVVGQLVSEFGDGYDICGEYRQDHCRAVVVTSQLYEFCALLAIAA